MSQYLWTHWCHVCTNTSQVAMTLMTETHCSFWRLWFISDSAWTPLSDMLFSLSLQKPWTLRTRDETDSTNLFTMYKAHTLAVHDTWTSVQLGEINSQLYSCKNSTNCRQVQIWDSQSNQHIQQCVSCATENRLQLPYHSNWSKVQ